MQAPSGSDPTQGSSEAGPSRLPYTGPVSSAPAPPPAPNFIPSTSTQPPSHSQARSIPTIVPTTIGQDGIRQVPHLFELCEVEDLIALIASMLDRLLSHNDRIPLTPTGLTRFHSRAPPSINVKDYLLRIARYTNVEPCCLLILLPYVDKVCARMNTFTISSLTVHRFVIAGVSVGSKALSDSFCTNGRYARVGGVSIAEMNLLEKEFCEAIDWRLTTTGTVLAHYYTSLVTAHPAYRLVEAPPPSPLATIMPAHSPSLPSNTGVPSQPSLNLKTPYTAQKIPLPDVSPQSAGAGTGESDTEMTSGSGELSNGTRRRKRQRGPRRSHEDHDTDELNDTMMSDGEEDHEDGDFDDDDGDDDDDTEAGSESRSASASISASSSSVPLSNGHGGDGSSLSRRSSSNLSFTAGVGANASPSSRTSPYDSQQPHKRSSLLRSPPSAGARGMVMTATAAATSGTSSPALIPPPSTTKRAQASASNLPSPVHPPSPVPVVATAAAAVSSMPLRAQQE